MVAVDQDCDRLGGLRPQRDLEIMGAAIAWLEGVVRTQCRQVVRAEEMDRTPVGGHVAKGINRRDCDSESGLDARRCAGKCRPPVLGLGRILVDVSLSLAAHLHLRAGTSWTWRR